MKEINTGTSAFIFQDINELSDVDKKLMQAAIKASRNAYAPYSGFSVGAALLMEDDSIIIGNNQENAAYPSGLCAERVAMFAASANYKDEEMQKLAIYAASETTAQKQISPCGSCRQVLLESETRQEEPIEVILMQRSGEIIVLDSAQNLLPFGFKR